MTESESVVELTGMTRMLVFYWLTQYPSSKIFEVLTLKLCRSRLSDMRELE